MIVSVIIFLPFREEGSGMKAEYWNISPCFVFNRYRYNCLLLKFTKSNITSSRQGYQRTIKTQDPYNNGLRNEIPARSWYSIFLFYFINLSNCFGTVSQTRKCVRNAVNSCRSLTLALSFASNGPTLTNLLLLFLPSHIPIHTHMAFPDSLNPRRTTPTLVSQTRFSF